MLAVVQCIKCASDVLRPQDILTIEHQGSSSHSHEVCNIPSVNWFNLSSKKLWYFDHPIWKAGPENNPGTPESLPTPFCRLGMVCLYRRCVLMARPALRKQGRSSIAGRDVYEGANYCFSSTFTIYFCLARDSWSCDSVLLCCILIGAFRYRGLFSPLHLPRQEVLLCRRKQCTV